MLTGATSSHRSATDDSGRLADSTRLACLPSLPFFFYPPLAAALSLLQFPPPPLAACLITNPSRTSLCSEPNHAPVPTPANHQANLQKLSTGALPLKRDPQPFAFSVVPPLLVSFFGPPPSTTRGAIETPTLDRTCSRRRHQKIAGEATRKKKARETRPERIALLALRTLSTFLPQTSQLHSSILTKYLDCGPGHPSPAQPILYSIPNVRRTFHLFTFLFFSLIPPSHSASTPRQRRNIYLYILQIHRT